VHDALTFIGTVSSRRGPLLTAHVHMDVPKLDRCFRSVAHMAQTVEQLRRWGVGLRSYSEPWLDTSGTSPVGDLMLNILASFAQFEKALIAERVGHRSGHAVKASGGQAARRHRLDRQPVPGERDGMTERFPLLSS
jgi:DNA invertase Pin-like site-specific DNA recombinase